ncbi:hypothetical protein VKI21_07190 [Cyanobacterium aponinum UTEX 3222]|uniref:Septum formation initiator n=3 Tax=Cyanobacterium aponinum TaxID=379064 RepID=K9Z773_CYAAP|nr:hypothetical protein [Cyanobacterium aponinum]WRL43461.1 hypothetical protein VKI21_07190 [Cyanobacterium aponinum UTEX 3222]AFZ54592.1 hypothetical protein Cyan10605_2511 [Cyanobacterium aponinum PCC 10605]MBD2394648.1 hypothetical protein [Cyanobacterium aponinum FACHB-4101]MTF39655.1 hypothetical protein [Cyanobacterium aponinum 0216]PHV63851.1 hypothetical protein CSQ80_03315 [Cyanobacterium aponinum IPPAS B-1201]
MNSNLSLKTRQRRRDYQESISQNRALKQQQRRQKRLNTEKAIETGLKMTVNISITIIAFFSVKQLLPYHLAQQAKLAEIDGEIAKIKPRVEKLEEDFGNTFDPKLTRKVIEKNTYKADPNLSPIFFIDKKQQDN